MVAGFLKELARGQVPRDIRQAVGVHADDGIRVARMRQRPTPILHDDVQVGLVHIEVLPPDFDDSRIDLDPIDGDVAVHGRILLGNRAGRQSHQGQAADVAWLERRRVK